MTPLSRNAEEEDVQPDPKPSVALSREQQRLHGALCAYTEELGAMYLGGLRVLQDPGNPDRVAQSAHSMRELMEKIGELESRAAEEGQSTGELKPRVMNLKEAFARLKRNTAGYSQPGVWTGPFDSHISRFLKKMDDFFGWMDSDRPSRRTAFQRTMAHLDASGRALPKPLRDRRYRDWKQMVSFFQKTSHHRSFPTVSELLHRIGELETFLSSVLVPTTFDDFNAIDALLKESGHA